MIQSLSESRELCLLRDYRYSTIFYGKPYFDVIRPLLETIRDDGGLSCFIGDKDKLLPEAAATCLLAFYRLRLVDQDTINKIQTYLIKSNAEVKRIELEEGDFDSNKINVENCAWSATQGKNAWSTSQILWALIASKYHGKYESVVFHGLNWLLKQQYSNGGWALVADKDNSPNVFITSIAVYTLKLSLKYNNEIRSKHHEISEAIQKGCRFIVNNRARKKPYWSYATANSDDITIEPTTTAMAIWALHHCAMEHQDTKTIVQQGVQALKRDLKGKIIWNNRIALEGYISETDVQQIFQGFTPAIALILLRLGVDPRDESVLKAIDLIYNIRGDLGWPFYTSERAPKSAAGFVQRESHYVGLGEPMTFITALALWTVEEWHKSLLIKDVNFQRELGNLQSRLLSNRNSSVVNRTHLAILLTICAVMVLSGYFSLINLIFKEPIEVLLSKLSISDVSDLIDSIAKLFFIPLVVLSLLWNFYLYGRFSFDFIKVLWGKLFW